MSARSHKLQDHCTYILELKFQVQQKYIQKAKLVSILKGFYADKGVKKAINFRQ